MHNDYVQFLKKLYFWIPNTKMEHFTYSSMIFFYFKGGTETQRTGPGRARSGYYYKYIESTGKQSGATAELVSNGVFASNEKSSYFAVVCSSQSVLKLMLWFLVTQSLSICPVLKAYIGWIIS